MSYTVMGISSGVGVSLFPFEENVIGNIEPRAIFYTKKLEQWRANFGGVPMVKTIEEYEELGYRPVNVDIIISSPDCGSGSVLRFSRAKKLGDHKKNHSLALFFMGIETYMPKSFLFENLDGLFKSFPENEFDAQLDGYHLIKHIAPVSRWGNSQIHRKRLIIVGIRKDVYKPKHEDFFQLPNRGHKVKTCIELYGDLEKENVKIAHVRESNDEQTTIYAGRKMKNSEITEWWLKNRKKKRWDECPGKKFSCAPGVYRNRKNDYPATARKANRQFDHNGLMLTPRQLARVQGVPDDFKIFMESDKLKYWINKGRAAVTKTPPMEISQWYKRKLIKSGIL